MPDEMLRRTDVDGSTNISNYQVSLPITAAGGRGCGHVAIVAVALAALS